MPHYFIIVRLQDKQRVKLVAADTLLQLTRTKAFFTKAGKILVIAPGSLHAGKTALDVMLPSLKKLWHTRHKKMDEENDA